MHGAALLFVAACRFIPHKTQSLFDCCPDLCYEDHGGGLVKGSAIHVDSCAQWQHKFDDAVLAPHLLCTLHAHLHLPHACQHTATGRAVARHRWPSQACVIYSGTSLHCKLLKYTFAVCNCLQQSERCTVVHMRDALQLDTYTRQCSLLCIMTTLSNKNNDTSTVSAHSLQTMHYIGRYTSEGQCIPAAQLSWSWCRNLAQRPGKSPSGQPKGFSWCSPKGQLATLALLAGPAPGAQ